MGNETLEQKFGQEEPEFFYEELVTAEDLDPNSPDYVARLDESLIAARRFYLDMEDATYHLAEEILKKLEVSSQEKIDAEYELITKQLTDILINTEYTLQELGRAISELTEVIPLREEGNFDHAHIYTVRDDIVHLTCAQPSSSVMTTYSYTRLRPEIYQDKDKMIDILTNEEGLDKEVDLYEAVNPSELIPEEVILASGLLKLKPKSLLN